MCNSFLIMHNFYIIESLIKKEIPNTYIHIFFIEEAADF
jgi:hypothetical protein